MLPRPRLDLSGTPGLRPIGLSPGSWQTSLGLGSTSRYSAQILICIIKVESTLQWRHIECHGVWNQRRLDCLLNRLFRRRSKKTSKLRVTWSLAFVREIHQWPIFPSQRASNAENVPILWRYHVPFSNEAVSFGSLRIYAVSDTFISIAIFCMRPSLSPYKA